MKRRTYLGSLSAALAQTGWWPFGTDTDRTEYENDPASNIQRYPLRHGVDVDAPEGAHHARPAAGAFIAEASDAFDLQVQKETDSWTMAAASSGTHTYSTGAEYDIAHVDTFLPVSGSVLSDLRAVPRSWKTDDDGEVTGIEVAWTNGTTSEQTGRVEVLGFQK